MRSHVHVMVALLLSLLAAASANAQVQLMNGIPVSGLSGSTGTQKLFVFSVPANASSLSISTVCNDPDADIYARWGSPPTTSTFHYKSSFPGSNESISVNNPSGGNLYILVHAHSSYGGLALLAQFNGGDNVDVVELDNGDTVNGLSGITGDAEYFKIALPAGLDWAKITLTGNDPDADLYVRWENLPSTFNYDAKSTSSNSNEIISINNPDGGDLYILVKAASTYINASLNVQWAGDDDGDSIELKNGVPFGGFGGVEGSTRLFSIELPDNLPIVTFQMYGGTGDADLYVRWEEPPTSSQWDYRPYLQGNGESVVVSNPAGGLVYLLVHAADQYSGVKLKVTYPEWKHFSHKSSPWKNDKMGDSNVKIKNGGAVLASLAMALQFTGSDVDPRLLNEFLTDGNGYVDGSTVKWSAAAAYDGSQGLKYIGPSSIQTMAKMRKALDDGKIVLARSARYGTTDHWIIIRYYTGNGNSWSKFRYWDPADGSPVDRSLGDGWVDQGAKTRVFQGPN